MASGGAVTSPNTGVTLHTAALITASSTRTYQDWFRNSVVFCTSSTFNRTDGAGLTWVP